MKVLIEVDADLWTKFREKVFHCRKTLREVVPTVIEPALKMYLEPPLDCSCPTEIEEPKPTVDGIIKSYQQMDQAINVRRCELCDMPTDKVFASGPYKVCYECWRNAGLTAMPEPNENNPSTSQRTSKPS